MKIVHYPLFPTIVLEIECDFFDEIESDLIDWIYEYQKVTESVCYSNRGGWQSPDNFSQNETFKNFQNYILTNAYNALKCYECNFNLGNMWISINKKGNYNICHDHAGSTISGVFWIKTPENCGELYFRSFSGFLENQLLDHVNDEIAKNYNYYSDFEFKPIKGTMILFASHLLHHVEENESDEDRISIAFNLNLL